MSALMDGLRNVKSKAGAIHKEMGDVEKEADRYGSGSSSDLQDGHPQLMDNMSRPKAKAEEKLKEVAQLEREIQTQSRRAVAQKEKQAEVFVGEKVQEITELEKGLENKGQMDVERQEHQTTAKAEKIVDAAAERLKENVRPTDPLEGQK